VTVALRSAPTPDKSRRSALLSLCNPISKSRYGHDDMRQIRRTAGSASDVHKQNVGILDSECGPGCRHTACSQQSHKL
jgi:hypothetical protein